MTSPFGRNETNLEVNNHESWQLGALASQGIYIGNLTLTSWAVERARLTVIGQQIATNGSLPKELARTRSAFYTTFALDAMFNLARYSRIAGAVPDLWTFVDTNGTTLHNALDFLVPYAVDGDPWPFPQVTDRCVTCPILLLRRVSIMLLTCASFQVTDWSWGNTFSTFLRGGSAWGKRYETWAQLTPGNHSADPAQLLWPVVE